MADAPGTDPTLRRGDAVVRADGVKVYVGKVYLDKVYIGRSRGDDDGFVSLAAYRRINSRRSARLRAYFGLAWPAKAARHARRNAVRLSKTLQAAPAPVSGGRVITAINGKKIKLVGGYFPPPQRRP